jgi:hypothetical protein
MADPDRRRTVRRRDGPRTLSWRLDGQSLTTRRLRVLISIAPNEITVFVDRGCLDTLAVINHAYHVNPFTRNDRIGIINGILEIAPDTFVLALLTGRARQVEDIKADPV